MFERRISHEGLKAYRVVRGSTEHDVHQKAEYQLAMWNDRWLSKQTRSQVVLGKERSIALAQQRTERARIELDGLASILSRALERPRFCWDSLKDQAVFSEMQSVRPPEDEYPVAPLRYFFRAQLSRLRQAGPAVEEEKGGSQRGAVSGCVRSFPKGHGPCPRGE